MHFVINLQDHYSIELWPSWTDLRRQYSVLVYSTCQSTTTF